MMNITRAMMASTIRMRIRSLTGASLGVEGSGPVRDRHTHGEAPLTLAPLATAPVVDLVEPGHGNG
jgi:hypothetical protein